MPDDEIIDAEFEVVPGFQKKPDPPQEMHRINIPARPGFSTGPTIDDTLIGAGFDPKAVCNTSLGYGLYRQAAEGKLSASELIDQLAKLSLFNPKLRPNA